MSQRAASDFFQRIPHPFAAPHGSPVPSTSAPAGDDVFLLIEDDVADGLNPRAGALPHVILVVDDERTVHETTLMALKTARIDGRPLDFLHAYSAAEGLEVFAANPQVSLILLDVVMETADAGLKFVSTVREELGQTEVKIILRTGQPGYAPEREVTEEYAINGYLRKAMLTRAMLFDAVARTLAAEIDPEDREIGH